MRMNKETKEKSCVPQHHRFRGNLNSCRCPHRAPACQHVRAKKRDVVSTGTASRGMALRYPNGLISLAKNVIPIHDSKAGPCNGSALQNGLFPLALGALWGPRRSTESAGSGERSSPEGPRKKTSTPKIGPACPVGDSPDNSASCAPALSALTSW